MNRTSAASPKFSESGPVVEQASNATGSKGSIAPIFKPSKPDPHVPTVSGAINSAVTSQQTREAIGNAVGSLAGTAVAAYTGKNPAIGPGPQQLTQNPATGGYTYNNPNAVGPGRY